MYSDTEYIVPDEYCVITIDSLIFLNQKTIHAILLFFPEINTILIRIFLNKSFST